MIKFQNFDNFGRVLRELYVTTDPLYLVKKGSMSVEGENMLMLGEFIYIIAKRQKCGGSNHIRIYNK